MRRQARQMRKGSISIDEFKSTSFFDVFETDAAYMDTYGNWQRSPDKKALVRADGSYISTVGKNYSIVNNEEYFNSVVNAIGQANIRWEPVQAYQENNGRRTTMIVQLPDFDLFPNTKEHQKFELRIVNSFDTTKAADTLIGFLRLICTNGMTAFDADFSCRMIHKGDVILKAEQAIELYKNFKGVWESNKALITRFGESYGRKDAVAKYIGDGEVSLNSIFKGERWANRLRDKWYENNETTNLWDLYNMFTNILSHEYGANYSSKLNKMQELNRESKRWDNIFEVNHSIKTITYGDIEEAMYVG